VRVFAHNEVACSTVAHSYVLQHHVTPCDTISC
jgi:hypothetical protein